MGRVTSRSCHYRNPTPRLLNRKTNDFAVLGNGAGGAFSSRSHDAEASRAGLDVVFDEAREGRPIDGAIWVHGRYQSNNASGYHRFTPRGPLKGRTDRHGAAIIHFRRSFTTA